MKKYYAGIGSRKTPENILMLMTKIAKVLDDKGFILRSGGADGADTAFANGAVNKEIFRPKHATVESIKIAMEVHPAPQACNDYVRKLHGRNVQIILGKNLDAPVEFVLCWTPGGKTIGGTGLGIRLAEREGIKVYNLFNKDHLAEVHERFLS
jgi:hypothetical protein